MTSQMVLFVAPLSLNLFLKDTGAIEVSQLLLSVSTIYRRALYLRVLLDNPLWRRTKEHVEVEDSSDRPVDHHGGGRQSVVCGDIM